MRIGINCGHTISGQPGCGAVGYIDESAEARRVGYLLTELLKKRGHQVFNCTNDIATSANENLKKIVSLANRQSLDAFYSIHFNAGGGKGTEVYTFGKKTIANADKICRELSGIGFKNRGIKDGAGLYVIRNTSAPAVLIEVCFVDSVDDCSIYKEVGAEQIATALCNAITGENSKEEDLKMDRYLELKNEIAELSKSTKNLEKDVYNLKNPMVYNYIDENMPDWARPTIKKLVDAGLLKGTGKGLNLTEGLLRVLVILDRANVY